MIGLGSNRLTVCRRGGMSVTQAGKGGMEWLAGDGLRGRTPYSAQATAALLAQFPTQWPTIRDYGFAHPEIVPYVNATPLIGGYISGAVEPNAAAYPIQLGLKAAKNFGFTFGSKDTLEFSFKKILASTNWFDFLYARQAWNSANAVGFIFVWTNNGDQNRVVASTTSGSSQSTILPNVQFNTWYTIKQDMRSGFYVDGVLKVSNTKAASWQSDGPLSIAKDAQDRISVNFINVKRNDVLIHRYYPIDNEGTWWDVIDGVIK